MNLSDCLLSPQPLNCVLLGYSKRKQVLAEMPNYQKKAAKYLIQWDSLWKKVKTASGMMKAGKN